MRQELISPLEVKLYSPQQFSSRTGILVTKTEQVLIGVPGLAGRLSFHRVAQVRERSARANLGCRLKLKTILPATPLLRGDQSEHPSCKARMMTILLRNTTSSINFWLRLPLSA
jgi:hypothetical protein